MTRYPTTAILLLDGMVIHLEPTCEAGAELVARLEAAVREQLVSDPYTFSCEES